LKKKHAEADKLGLTVLTWTPSGESLRFIGYSITYIRHVFSASAKNVSFHHFLIVYRLNSTVSGERCAEGDTARTGLKIFWS